MEYNEVNEIKINLSLLLFEFQFSLKPSRKRISSEIDYLLAHICNTIKFPMQ